MSQTIERFVREDSAAGGNGSQDRTDTLDRAYHTKADWESAEQGDLDVHHDVTVSSISGTFEINEPLSFAPSSATATLKRLVGSTMTYEVLTGTPTDADGITGDDSTATCNIDTIDDTNGSEHHMNHTEGVIADIARCIVDGWTVSVNNFITINGVVATQAAYDETRPRQEYVYDGGYQGSIELLEPFTILNDYQIKIYNDGFNQGFGLEVGADLCELNRCIGVGNNLDQTGSFDVCILINDVSSGSPLPDFAIVRSCLVYDFENGTDPHRAHDLIVEKLSTKERGDILLEKAKEK